MNQSPAVSDDPRVALASDEPAFEPAVAVAESEEMAQRELYLSLQLLANRAQRLTQASAATIAVGEGEQSVCRVSAGPMAAAVGTELRAYPTLIQKSIETQQIVCCNDVGTLAHPNGTLYSALGIKSMMVMPLIRDQQPVAMFELLADRTQAFHDPDGAVLERLSEMVLIALARADAGRRAQEEITLNSSSEARAETENQTESLSSAESQPIDENQTAAASLPAIEKVGTCQACGFPVSDGRTFCLDCEEARQSRENSESAPAFLSQLARQESRSWFESNFYTLATVLMVLLTLVILILKFR
jgi:GAF domain-containing protein